MNGGMCYGPGSSRQRHDDRGVGCDVLAILFAKSKHPRITHGGAPRALRSKRARIYTFRCVDRLFHLHGFGEAELLQDLAKLRHKVAESAETVTENSSPIFNSKPERSFASIFVPRRTAHSGARPRAQRRTSAAFRRSSRPSAKDGAVARNPTGPLPSAPAPPCQESGKEAG
jgi:hypothetical protein